jgi:predicted outer membrane protein
MNRSSNVVAALAVVTAIAACSKKSQPPKQSAAATAASRQPRTAEAAGEVAKDSAAPHDNIKWLSDANVVAMLTAMNQRQVAAADAELSTWHIDTVRAFATAMYREHTALQHSIDSLAEVAKIAPVLPALGATIRGRMQAQIDTIYQHGGRGFDRAYVMQAVAGHQLMAQYLGQFSAVAEAPALATLIGSMTTTVQSQIARANAMRVLFAVADSVTADSLRRVEERRAARAAKKG